MRGMMKSERWRQVDQLFQAALERSPEERAAFINAACGDDVYLRREVEALLAADVQAGSFIESPAYAVAAPLLVEDETPSRVGQSIGHYRIISLVGKGGMGEVYRARDTRLDRTVALKILPAEVLADDERLRRFFREAKAASALNHPNVAHIYEIAEASTEDDSVSFIAMEYIEGQTLAARINGHPLEAGEIVEIGSQITDALLEAHDKGITHRDIKPANAVFSTSTRQGHQHDGEDRAGCGDGNRAVYESGAGSGARGGLSQRPVQSGCGAVRDGDGAITILRGQYERDTGSNSARAAGSDGAVQLRRARRT
jgi:hypothetical protein